MYESVLPHFDALIANTQQTNVEKSETELSDHTSSAPSTPDITQSNSVRYVDHPIQLSHLCIDKNESDCDDCSPPAATGNEQRSHLRSIVTDNQMGMFTSNSEKQVTTPSTAEESYTFMNPAGTLTLSLSAGWEEQQLN